MPRQLHPDGRTGRRSCSSVRPSRMPSTWWRCWLRVSSSAAFMSSMSSASGDRDRDGGRIPDPAEVDELDQRPPLLARKGGPWGADLEADPRAAARLDGDLPYARRDQLPAAE